MEITKANLSFGSRVSKRFPYCGLLLSIEKKNRLPHVFYSIIAKKAVFRRQKQIWQGRDFIGPSATSGNKHHCSESFEQIIGGRGE